MKIEGANLLKRVGAGPMELVVFHEIRERNFETICARFEKAAMKAVIKSADRDGLCRDLLPRWMRQRIKESALVYLYCMAASSYLTLSYLFSFADHLFSVDKWEEPR